MFGLFKPAPGRVLLDQLKSVYILEQKTPDEPSIMGKWWEGQAGTSRVAFQDGGNIIIMHVGKPAEEVDIYLTAADPNPSERDVQFAKELERIVGPEGRALSSRFGFGAMPGEEGFDFPQLRLPELRYGIPKFSASVEGIAIFLEGQCGLSLTLNPALATAETVDKDISIARSILAALKA